MKKTCIYSTSDDKYVGKALVALLTARNYNSDLPLFIISSYLSPDSKKLLEKYDIKYIEADLSKDFDVLWDYPVECYYIFAGPHLLQKEGYDYSLYIDGDIYCNKKIDQKVFDNVKGFAGVSNRTVDDMLKADLPVLSDHFDTDKIRGVNRLQTGVVFFNNRALTRKGFYKKMVALYKKANSIGTPRKGDDSLFALFRLAYPDWSYRELSPHYNLLTGAPKSGNDWLTADEKMINTAYFVHFTDHVKPWQETLDFPTYTYKYFYNAWRRQAIDCLQNNDLKKFFPAIHNTLTKKHLRFYWYPGNNVGDLVTSYYLKKVCGVDSAGKFSIDEPTIMALEAKQLHPPLIKRLAKRLAQKKPAAKKALYSVSTGSVVRLCGDYAMVWGSGIRSKDQEVHNSLVRSVRGPLTRQRYLDSGVECPPLFGDPGLLMPHFYKPSSRKKYRLGIIPHFTEFEEVSRLYADESEILVINMGCGDLEQVVDQIASCRATVSSSLHGLVFSHAYKIPTGRIVFSDKVHGDGTKYDDYYQGIGLKPAKPANAMNFKKIPIERLNKSAKENLRNYDDSRLFEAMFFDESSFRKSAFYPF